jgi:hypothetical protein
MQDNLPSGVPPVLSDGARLVSDLYGKSLGLQNGRPWGVNVQAQPKEAGAGSRLRPILLVFFRRPVNTCSQETC